MKNKKKKSINDLNVVQPVPLRSDNLNDASLENAHSKRRFNPREDRWELARNISVDVGRICRAFPNQETLLRNGFVHIAQEYAPGTCQRVQSDLVNLSKWLEREKRYNEFNEKNVSDYINRVDPDQYTHLKIMVAALSDEGDLFSESFMSGLYRQTRRASRNRKNITSSDGKKGPLYDSEYNALIVNIARGFADNRISHVEALLVDLYVVTGRRKSQIVDCKIKDLGKEKTGKWVLNIPRAKKKRSRSGAVAGQWRGEFKPFYLHQDLVERIQYQCDMVVKSVESSLSEKCGLEVSLDHRVRGELPMFPSGALGRVCTIEELMKHMTLDTYHAQRGSVAEIVLKVGKLSTDRNGNPLHLQPHRLRHTLGHRMAESGRAPAVIADMLDHRTLSTVKYYCNAAAYDGKIIEEKLGDSLALIARAMTGQIINVIEDDVEDAQVLANKSGVLGSKCGDYAWCPTSKGAHRYGCYACPNFRPLRDANHQSVLDDVIKEHRQRVEELEKSVDALGLDAEEKRKKSRVFVGACTELIACIKATIQKCDEAKPGGLS